MDRCTFFIILFIDSWSVWFLLDLNDTDLSAKPNVKHCQKNILFRELFAIVQNLIKILLKLKRIGNQVLNLYHRFQTIYCFFLLKNLDFD